MLDYNLAQFIQLSYSPELGNLLLRACDCFDKFGVEDYDDELLDIIMSEAYIDKSDVADRLVMGIRTKLDFIIESHKLSLNDDISFNDVVIICEALYNLQHLANYLPVLKVLEDQRPDEEQLADILGDISELEFEYLLTIIDAVSNDTMAKLKEYAQAMVERDSDITVDDKEPYNKALMLYSNAIGPNAGADLVKSGLLVGADIRTYLSYFSDVLVSEDDDVTAKNILGILLASAEGLNGPLQTYRKISHYLFNDDLNKISIIEAKIVGLLNVFNEYKRVTGGKG